MIESPLFPVVYFFVVLAIIIPSALFSYSENAYLEDTSSQYLGLSVSAPFSSTSQCTNISYIDIRDSSNAFSFHGSRSLSDGIGYGFSLGHRSSYGFLVDIGVQYIKQKEKILYKNSSAEDKNHFITSSALLAGMVNIHYKVKSIGKTDFYFSGGIGLIDIGWEGEVAIDKLNDALVSRTISIDNAKLSTKIAYKLGLGVFYNVSLIKRSPNSLLLGIGYDYLFSDKSINILNKDDSIKIDEGKISNIQFISADYGNHNIFFSIKLFT